jgi:hypothetical protein
MEVIPMTTDTRELRSDASIARAQRLPAPSAVSTGDLTFGLIDALSGAGLVFMSFLAPIPGLLPAVALTALLVAPLLIPPLVLGAVAWLAYIALRVTLRLSARVIAAITRAPLRRAYGT